MHAWRILMINAFERYQDTDVIIRHVCISDARLSLFLIEQLTELLLMLCGVDDNLSLTSETQSHGGNECTSMTLVSWPSINKSYLNFFSKLYRNGN